MYTYTPKPNRTPAVALAAVCFFAAFALFSPLDTETWLLIFLRGVGTGLFLVGFVALDRYAFTSFSYSIEVSGDVPGLCDFAVVSLRYGRRRTVCRVSVDNVSDIVKYDREEKARKNVRKYNYCPDMTGNNRYILFVEDEGEAAIRFCPDEEMVRLIKNIINRK